MGCTDRDERRVGAFSLETQKPGRWGTVASRGRGGSCVDNGNKRKYRSSEPPHCLGGCLQPGKCGWGTSVLLGKARDTEGTCQRRVEAEGGRSLHPFPGTTAHRAAVSDLRFQAQLLCCVLFCFVLFSREKCGSRDFLRGSAGCVAFELCG